jgi:hypothetical protein
VYTDGKANDETHIVPAAISRDWKRRLIQTVAVKSFLLIFTSPTIQLIRKAEQTVALIAVRRFLAPRHVVERRPTSCQEENRRCQNLPPGIDFEGPNNWQGKEEYDHVKNDVCYSGRPTCYVAVNAFS